MSDQIPTRVIIESPFAGGDGAGDGDLRVFDNGLYARACLLDSLARGEAPLASHLLYTQVLDDEVKAEREQGMSAGFAWTPLADVCAVYLDRGVSGGMRIGIERALAAGVRVELRVLDPSRFAPFALLCRETHSVFAVVDLSTPMAYCAARTRAHLARVLRWPEFVTQAVYEAWAAHGDGRGASSVFEAATNLSPVPVMLDEAGRVDRFARVAWPSGDRPDLRAKGQEDAPAWVCREGVRP